MAVSGAPSWPDRREPHPAEGRLRPVHQHDLLVRELPPAARLEAQADESQIRLNPRSRRPELKELTTRGIYPEEWPVAGSRLGLWWLEGRLVGPRMTR